jgi:hypothetical protein
MEAVWHPAYDQDSAIIYLLDSGVRLVRCNPSWDLFARQNGGPDVLCRSQLGRCVMDVIAAPLLPFYEDGYHRVQRRKQEWEHEFECSSADTFRWFRMRCLPAAASGVLVINTLLTQAPHHPGKDGSPQKYRDTHGVVTMCVHCRRTRNVGFRSQWDWVPGNVACRPTALNHGLCPACSSYYYPEQVL